MIILVLHTIHDVRSRKYLYADYIAAEHSIKHNPSPGFHLLLAANAELLRFPSLRLRHFYSQTRSYCCDG